jgi:hypothetical protein
MGSETEYAFSGDASAVESAPDDLYHLLTTALRQDHAAMQDRYEQEGVFLEHGGRLYLDYGGHPEHATPECTTPKEVACYDKAGERLLESARARVYQQYPGVKIALIKNNLDPIYPDHTTYGTHESYTCWRPAFEIAPQLLPHLVSRTIFAGAGGLTADAQGRGFELSQRARHIVEETGCDTTDCRALFSMRVRNTSDQSDTGWVRAHLISKDSQRSPFGVYLTFATTGLLFWLVNQGVTVGKGLALLDPINSLRRISRDPWLRQQVVLKDGRKMTALEIQSCLLEECERAWQRGVLPDWAPEALRHWRDTLSDLARDPLRLANRLDPYCKLLIYEHELLRANLDWDDLRIALARLTELRSQYCEEVVVAILKESAAGISPEAQIGYDKAQANAWLRQPREMDKLRFAVRLQALDIRYHELGGLYDSLHAAGRMQDVVLTAADIERATQEAPQGGRAAVRGAWIKEHQGPGWFADWEYLWHPTSGQCVDLRDPFSSETRLRQFPVNLDIRSYPNILQLLEQPAAAS